MPAVTTFNALLSGLSWNGLFVAGRPTFVSYSFDTAASAAFAGEFPAAFLDSFQPLSAAEQMVARAALDAWAGVSGLTFLEVPAGQGDIRFGAYDFTLGPQSIQDSVAFAYQPAVFDAPDGAFEFDFGGDVFIDLGLAQLGVLLHEIGHALGLKHPFEGQVTLDPSVDDFDHTVMTYNTGGLDPKQLGAFDIEAIQFLYGLSTADGTQAASWSWDGQRNILTQAGGAGNDKLAGVAVQDRIAAGAGDDYVMTRGGGDAIDGEAGNDTLAGGLGDDTVTGGAGDDVIDGDEGEDSLSGGDGDDDIWGLDGDDTITGDLGADTLHANQGLNRLSGGDGDDVLVISSGVVIADGGDGYDELWLAPPSSASVTLSYASLTAGGGSYAGIESIVLFGDVNADTLQGGVLIDVLVGGGGTDSLSGGADDDELFGEAGADTLSGGSGADTIDGSSGDDLITPGDGADDIWGGAGVDTVDFSVELSGVELVMNASRLVDGAAETMQGVENILGSPFGDRITGDANANRIFGAAGSDTLLGGEGANYLRGDDGGDSLSGGSGFDDINGNLGDDTSAGGLGDDWVVGGKENDTLSGDAGGDLVYGNSGADTCDGGEGADTLRGGQDNDIVRGGAGEDFVSGDRGDDTMSGGDGADIFHTFGDTGLDRVLDFNLAQGDRVMLDPGVQFTVSQSGSDTVISMTGGGQVVLVGVAMSSLTGNWIFGA